MMFLSPFINVIENVAVFMKRISQRQITVYACIELPNYYIKFEHFVQLIIVSNFVLGSSYPYSVIIKIYTLF